MHLEGEIWISYSTGGTLTVMQQKRLLPFYSQNWSLGFLFLQVCKLPNFKQHILWNKKAGVLWCLVKLPDLTETLLVDALLYKGEREGCCIQDFWDLKKNLILFFTDKKPWQMTSGFFDLHGNMCVRSIMFEKRQRRRRIKKYLTKKVKLFVLLSDKTKWTWWRVFCQAI